METEREKAIAGMLAALNEIAIGRGPYRIDPLEHAASVIEAMKEEAKAAIAAAESAGITTPALRASQEG